VMLRHEDRNTRNSRHRLKDRRVVFLIS